MDCGPFPTMLFSTSRQRSQAQNGSTKLLVRGKVPGYLPGRMVVGHADWSPKHFRFMDGKVGVIYDWDSLRLAKETNLVGHTATHFPYAEYYTEYFDVPRRASPEEARCFVEDYESV